MTEITPEALRSAIELLEKIVQDRTLLTSMDDDERLALLIAAGRISRPTRHELMRTAKNSRKATGKNDGESDRDARAGTEIRAARRAEVFTAPPQLAPGVIEAAEAEAPELIQARACY